MRWCEGSEHSTVRLLCPDGRTQCKCEDFCALFGDLGPEGLIDSCKVQGGSQTLFLYVGYAYAYAFHRGEGNLLLA